MFNSKYVHIFCFVILGVGLQSSCYQTRIIGGMEVSIYEYPYAVSIQFLDLHICGGAIINNKTIITAAHCIRFPEAQYKIRAGSTYANSDGIIVDVKNISIHPNYNRKTADFDICILTLSSPLVFDKNIQPIGLPKNNQAVLPNIEAVIVGWGTTDINNPDLISNHIRRVYLRTMTSSVCARIFPPLSITTNMICAVSDLQEDTCNGDSGGPMVANGVIIGIVSWGMSCVDPLYPGVYTAVSKQINFISSKM